MFDLENDTHFARASEVEAAYRRVFARWRRRVVEALPVGYKAKLRNAGELLAYDLIGVGIFTFLSVPAEFTPQS